MSSLFLRIQGLVLGIVHVTCSAIALFMTISKNFNTDFPLHYNKNVWVDCKTFRHEEFVIPDKPLLQMRIRDWCNHTTSDKAMSYSEPVWFDIGFGWLVFTYFIWTGLFHIFYVTFWWNRYTQCVIEDRQCFFLRWFEYAWSASVMMFMISYFLGITNIFVLCFVCLIFYFIIALPFIVNKNGTLQDYVIAGVTYIVLWAFLFAIFFCQNQDWLDRVPGFVYAIIFIEFVLYNVFPIIFVIERWRIKNDMDLILTESLYNLFSALSKLLLGIILGFFVFM